jgi:hypothetical protein
MPFIKTVDQSKLCKDVKIQVEQAKRFGKRRGIRNKPIDDALPTYEKAQAEKIITDSNNNFIIMGRDRPTHPASGYGREGATSAARIDLIAGMASSFPSKGPDGNIVYGPPCSGTVVNPNFAMDGARVYISQKAKIDKYMGLAQTPRDLPSADGSSAIGLKADAIRIHARSDVKIVTGQGKFENAGEKGERLAHGGLNERVGSISFIAGNGAQIAGALQPVIKGDNLTQCLHEMFSIMSELYAMVKANSDHISQLNTSTGAHIHTLAAPAPIPTIPSPTQLPFAAVLSVLDMVERASADVMSQRIRTVAERYLKINDEDPEPYRNIKSTHVFTT